MLTTTRRRVVEEEVTEVVSPTSALEAWKREQREWMKHEQKRLDSFLSWWLDDCQLDISVAQRLAKAGFYRCGFSFTECYSCRLCKHWSFWREGQDPETVHREERPDCKFITGQSDNVPIERWMRYEQNRLDSFTSRWLDLCELDVSVAQRLAKDGFYHWRGFTDCFSCGLCKHSSFWQEGHDPETVHHPNCKFMTGQSDYAYYNATT